MAQTQPQPRAQPRVRFRAPAVITAGGVEHHYPRTGDAGMDGVFISTVRPLPLGTRGRFSIRLSAGMRREAIEGECQVARVIGVDDGLCGGEPGPGMRIEFLSLDGESAELLRMVMAFNSP